MTDVAELDSVRALHDAAIKQFGAVHVVCNNAGIGAGAEGPMWEHEQRDWQWALAVNVWGVINGITAFVPTLFAQGDEGHVINTSSGNGGLAPLPSTPQYAVTKAAVVTLTECLYAQLGPQHDMVSASVLFPGPHMLAHRAVRVVADRGPNDSPRPGRARLPYVTVEQLEEQMRAAGVEPTYTEPADVADQGGGRTPSRHVLDPARERPHRRHDRGSGRLDARPRANPDLPRRRARAKRQATTQPRSQSMSRATYDGNEPYVVISADSHAGLPTEQYRQYLERKYWPAFDDFLAGRPQALAEHSQVRASPTSSSPSNGSTRTAKASRVAGMPRDATRRWMPTASAPRSSSPMPTPSRAGTCAPFGTGLGLSGDHDPELGLAGCPCAQPLAGRDVRRLTRAPPRRRPGPDHGAPRRRPRRDPAGQGSGLSAVMIPAMWMSPGAVPRPALRPGLGALRGARDARRHPFRPGRQATPTTTTSASTSPRSCGGRPARSGSCCGPESSSASPDCASG